MEYIVKQSLKRGILSFLWLFFNCIWLPLAGLAQHKVPESRIVLSGTITDTKTDSSLSGASVYVKESQMATTTDNRGYYILKLTEGKHTIVISYLGYESMEEVVVLNKSNRKKHFKLREKPNELSEVTVTAHKGAAVIKEIRQSPMAVSVIDGKRLRGVTSGINDILSRTSGITIRKEGGLGNASRISIHGLEGKRVAVFIGGFPLNSPDGSFDINDIPVDVIERIEVYKGIVPAEFGGDGLGGAINIVTREIHCDMIAATLETGSYNLSKSLFGVKKVFEKPGIQISLAGFHNRSNNDYVMNLKSFDPDSHYSRVKRNNDFFRSSMLVSSIIFTKLWFDEIEIETAFYDNKKELQHIFFDSRFAYTYGTNIMPILKLKKNDFFLKGLDLLLSSVSPIVHTHLVDTVPYIYQWNGEKTSHKGETTDDLLNLSDNKQFEFRNKLNLKYTLNDKHRFNLNNQFAYANRKPKDDYLIDYLGYDPSAFPSKMTSNITGLAYEYSSPDKRFQNIASFKSYYLQTHIYRTEEVGVSGSGSKQEPGITSSKAFYWGGSEGASYELWKGFRIKAAYEHAVRLPDTQELFGDGTVIRSSVNLKPEKSDNLSAGVILDRSHFLGMERVQLEANAFYMRTKELISLAPADHRMAFQNIDNTLIKGFDADLRVDIIPQLYGYFNLTYQRLHNNKKWETDDHKTPNPKYGKQVPNIPTFYYNAGVEFHQSDFLLKNEYFRLFADYSYVGRFNYAWAMSNRKEQEYRWSIPACHNLSAGIQQSFLKNQLSLCIEVSNILNTQQYNNYKMPLPGCTFNIKLRYNWFKDRSEGGAMAF